MICKVFSGTGSLHFVRSFCALTGLPRGNVAVAHYTRGEISVKILENVEKTNVIFIKQISKNINNDVLEVLQFVDVAKRMKAKTITVVLPCFPYTRQNKADCCCAQGGVLLAKLLVDLGVHRIVTFDIHTLVKDTNYPAEFTPIFLENFWCNYINSLKFCREETVVFGADKGATVRAQNIAQFLKVPWGFLEKKRNLDGTVTVINQVGNCKGKHVFLLDDLMGTGATIAAAAKMLRANGCVSITVLVTHCCLNAQKVAKLLETDIEHIVVSDTVPIKKTAALEVISVIPTLAEQIKLLLCG